MLNKYILQWMIAKITIITISTIVLIFSWNNLDILSAWFLATSPPTAAGDL